MSEILTVMMETTIRVPMNTPATTTTLATAPKEALKRFGALMADLRETVASTPLDQAIDKVLERTGYASELRDGTDEGEERWRNVLELRRVQHRICGLESSCSAIVIAQDKVVVSCIGHRQHPIQGRPVDGRDRAGNR